MKFLELAVMPEKLAKLERRLSYKFQDPRLLERALTHRSWAHENRTGGEPSRDAQNESLEFVGDSVLGLAIAEELYLKNPTLNEGHLTLMKHRLVSTETLARLAVDLNIGAFMRIGRGEEKTGGRGKHALLADALEAVIGAIFFDAGYIEARHFVRKIFSKELKKATPDTSVDYKTLLQEKLQAQRLTAPQYRVTKTEGLPHARTFSVEAVWETGTSAGQGSSIKSAEMMAAKAALESLNGGGQKTKMKPREARRRTANQHNE
ncbi:MAG TPA: ribonuclease III [Pyrinomonadaceae bacterium]|nr:ribonuclease III [Pyrinomonadaceae bacterium]